MSLKKISSIDRIEILADGQIQVRRRDSIIEDGKEIAAKFHRHALAPGQDTNNEDPRVKAIAKAAWTPATIKAYLAAKAARERTK